MSTTNERLLKVFNSFDRWDEVLILENDNALSHDVEKFRDWLLKNAIPHTIIFDIGSVSIDYLKNRIKWHNKIAFQSQWVHDISFELKDFVLNKCNEKIIVECYLSEPKLYYQPDGCDHKIYVFTDNESEITNDWKFTKLRKDKAIWDGITLKEF